MQKLLNFFSKNISIYVIFNDQSFNDTFTTDIVSFEELGLDLYQEQWDKTDIQINSFLFLHENVVWALMKIVLVRWF